MSDQSTFEVKDSFVHGSEGESTFDASDTASDSGSSLEASQNFTETVDGDLLTEVDVSGEVSSVIGPDGGRLTNGESRYTVTFFEGDEGNPIPVTYRLSGTMSVAAADQPFDAAIVQVRLEDFDSGDDVVDVRIAASDGQDSDSLNASGTLPIGGSLEVSAVIDLRPGPAPPPMDASGSALFDLQVTLEYQCPPGVARTEVAADQCVGDPTGHILFTRGAQSENVFVISADDSNPTAPLNLGPNAERSVSDPAWARNGERLVYIENTPAGGNVLMSMTAGGSDQKQITGGARNPEVSPNGTRIAYECDPGICVVNADGTNQTQLVANGDNPAWSPGGQKIVFDRSRQGNRDIFSIAATGTDSPVQLTDDEAADTDPDFAPGGQIVFVSNRDGNPELYRVRSVAGSEAERLTDSPGFDGDPTVSPDGDFVGFVSARDGNRDIFAMPLAGGEATNLTDTAAPEFDPNWGISSCFYGTAGSDQITRPGHVCGGPGPDRLTGGGAEDTLDGGAGRDTVDGKGGTDLIFGGDERPQGEEIDDRLRGGEDRDRIFAGAGNDKVIGGGEFDQLHGELGADHLDGDGATPDPANDQIGGGRGGDTILGGPGGDLIFGDEGQDVIDGEEGRDDLLGGPDRDVFTACDGLRDDIFGGLATGSEPGDTNDEARFDQGVDVLNDVEVRVRC